MRNNQNIKNLFNFVSMKNNQYLEKYGEKALQIYNKKSLKQTLEHDSQNPSDGEHNKFQNKSIGRGVQKSMKSSSNKSLNRGSKSKSKIAAGLLQNQYTFQKPLNLQNLQPKDKNRKKLIISGLSTPKNRSTRMISGVQQRIQSSSTKKKTADIKITEKLNDVLNKGKTTKSVVKQLLECLDMISQHQCKINKWINQFKDIVYHIAEQASGYRKKYKQQVLKNKKIQKDYEQLQINSRSTIDKKRKSIQMIIMEQNQKLKEKVAKLEIKIQNYEKKQMILIQTLQKIKGLKKGQQYETNSSSKKEQNYVTSKIKAEFYGSLDEDEEDQNESNEQFQENL